VIVNNTGQVNIAADGGQQVNVQSKRKGMSEIKKRSKKIEQ
jgi:hypothetical protein